MIDWFDGRPPGPIPQGRFSVCAIITTEDLFNSWIRKTSWTSWTSRSTWVKMSLHRSIARSAVNIEPAICNDHLPYPWGRRWREGRVESCTHREGRAKSLREGTVRRLVSLSNTERSENTKKKISTEFLEGILTINQFLENFPKHMKRSCKMGPIFSSYNPLQSCPSVVRDSCL